MTCDIISRNPQPWKIVPAHFLLTCSVMGIIKSIGVYFPELRMSLSATATDVGVIIGLFSALLYGPGEMSYY